MNWDAIGAIAELLGAIGVIASLVGRLEAVEQQLAAASGGTNR